MTAKWFRYALINKEEDELLSIHGSRLKAQAERLSWSLKYDLAHLVVRRVKIIAQES